MSSSIIEWLMLVFDEFVSECGETLDINTQSNNELITIVGCRILDIDRNNDNAYNNLIDMLNTHYGGRLYDSLISSKSIVCEAILCYSMTDECIWRDICISKILQLERDIQVELMNIIQLNMSEHFTSFVESEDIPIFVLTSDIVSKPTSSTSYCMECKEKDDIIHSMQDKLEKSETKIVEIESKLKSSMSSETHKLIDAEIQVIEKERRINDMNSELYDLKSKLSDYDRKYNEYEKLLSQVQVFQDKVEILQPQAKKAESYEIQLEKLREKLDEYKGIKQQYQDETKAHSVTYGKFLEVEAEVDALKKVKSQVDEYREQLSEVTIELQELRLRLSVREDELMRLQAAYDDVCRDHHVNIEERMQLSHNLSETNELLRLNKQPVTGLGEGISEFNPVLMQEVSKLRAENHDLHQQLDASSLASLDRLNKEVADQTSMNASLTKKLVDTKDQLAFAVMRIATLERDYASLAMEYQLYRQQQDEVRMMADAEMQAQHYDHQYQMMHQKLSSKAAIALMMQGKDAVISSLSDDIYQLQQLYDTCSSTLDTTIYDKLAVEHELSSTKTEFEHVNRKREREHDDHINEVNRMKEETTMRHQHLLSSHADDLKLVEMKNMATVESYEERIQSMQSDLEEEHVKRRRIEREKRALESDIHRYKTQAQSNNANLMNTENMEVMMKEFKVMQQELEYARVEIISLRSNGSHTNHPISINSTSAKASSSDNVDASQSSNPPSKLSRPVRLRVSSTDPSSTSNSITNTSYDTAVANYMDVADMTDRKLEVLSREKRELLAKNLESDKEKAEMNQRLLQNDKDLAAYKSKVTKLTLEKERLERKLARQLDDSAMTAE